MTEEVFKAIWKNGAEIKILYYTTQKKGFVNSDRIELIVKAEDKEPRSWMMNKRDASNIIWGLAKAMDRAMDDNIPDDEGNN